MDLVIVDRMQLMGADVNARGLYEKMTAISRAVKITAAEVGVPLLSQTSRSHSREQRTESGAIEETQPVCGYPFEHHEDAAAAKADLKGPRERVT